MRRRDKREFVLVMLVYGSVFVGVGIWAVFPRPKAPVATICPVSDVPQLKAAPQPVAEPAPTPSPKIHFVLVK